LTPSPFVPLPLRGRGKKKKEGLPPLLDAHDRQDIMLTLERSGIIIYKEDL